MGKIDKEKLLSGLPCAASGFCTNNNSCKYNETHKQLTVSACVGAIIKNFPEEPEQPIDFDALYEEFNTGCIAKECSGCDIKSIRTRCFINFLKSKNLTQPKPFEIPVKKTWTLKKEYVDFCKTFGFDIDSKVITDKNLQYYDMHEPDYSKIPKGSIVEFTHNRKELDYFVRFENGNIVCTNGTYVPKLYSNIRIVELAKE